MTVTLVSMISSVIGLIEDYVPDYQAIALALIFVSAGIAVVRGFVRMGGR